MEMFLTGLVTGLVVSALWVNRSTVRTFLSELTESVASSIRIQWMLFKQRRSEVKQWDPMDEPMEMNYDPRQDRKDV